jgi:hypothetical protein
MATTEHHDKDEDEAPQHAIRSQGGADSPARVQRPAPIAVRGSDYNQAGGPMDRVPANFNMSAAPRFKVPIGDAVALQFQQSGVK